jgi:coenzyme F420-reducing hydrogenase beta subunit
MIIITDKSKCCGCNACANICPKNCIKMKRDEEGFLYPDICQDECISCNICESVCPEINVRAEVPFKQDGYIVQIKDENIRRESTAGGAFSAIARYIIQSGGVVFGVVMDDKFLAHHTYVESELELQKYRNSKYVQSFVGESTFKQVKEFLNKGRTVCFSGTPCQIEGLKLFLKEDYKKLITVDVVCRAVPSPLAFEKYIELQNKCLGTDIINVRFRDKYFGYKYSTMNICTAKNNVSYHRGIESDPWLRAFFSGICNRPSCYECSFRKRYRVSDFTIWDCFSVRNFSKKMDDDKGTTRMLVHTSKGREIFDKIKEEMKYVELNPDEIVNGVKEIFEPSKRNPKRDEFMADLNILDAEKLFKKYFPNTIKVKIKRFIRIALYKLRIYKFVKNFYSIILKR